MSHNNDDTTSFCYKESYNNIGCDDDDDQEEEVNSDDDMEYTENAINSQI